MTGLLVFYHSVDNVFSSVGPKFLEQKVIEGFFQPSSKQTSG